MITIRALLDRIRWDREFGLADFSLGYFDRLQGRVIVIPLAKAAFDPQDRSVFQLHTAAGEPLSIPLHRVCEVYRNGELIWRRARCSSQRRDVG